jgi:hypothetical protein
MSMKTAMKMINPKKIRKRINKEELRKRTWKYFWKQKIGEISITLLIIIVLTIIPYLLGLIGCSINPHLDKFLINNESNACTLHQAWYKFYFMGWGVLFCLAFLTFVIFIITYAIRKLIINNWEKAEERAREELKNE